MAGVKLEGARYQRLPKAAECGGGSRNKDRGPLALGRMIDKKPLEVTKGHPRWPPEEESEYPGIPE